MPEGRISWRAAPRTLQSYRLLAALTPLRPLAFEFSAGVLTPLPCSRRGAPSLNPPPPPRILVARPPFLRRPINPSAPHPVLSSS